METERTKDRRLLREKRLAYFEKNGFAPKPQPHPPQQSYPLSSSLTESKEPVQKSQRNKKGNILARKSVNKSQYSKETPNGHVSLLRVSSSPRRILGAASGGNVTPGKGGQQSLYNKKDNKVEPGARPKVRSQQYVNGGIIGESNHVDDRNQLEVSRKHALRNTFSMQGKEVKSGERSIRDSREDKYESLTWSRDEHVNNGAYLAPVSVPMVIQAEHGLFKMGTKEQPQEQIKEDDLYEVFRLERRYDYPRGRALVGHSYQDAQKAAMEHNAFGVDNMLYEMRQVRKVKSQLHEELRERFDTFGNVSKMLGKGSRGNGEERGARIKLLDESANIRGYQNNLEKNLTGKENDVEVSAVDCNESFENKNSQQKEIGHCLLERKDGSLENQSEGGEIGHSKIDSIVHTIEEDVFSGAHAKQGNHEDENNEEVQEEDEFNLGALCAAAKQGDDILKDYIKRLTQKILNKDTAETKESHLVRSKFTYDWQSSGQGLGEGLTHSKGHKQTEKFANSPNDEKRLFTSSQLVNGYHYVQEDCGPFVSKVHSATYSSDQLKHLGYENIAHDDTKIEDVLSNDSESSSHEIHSLDAMVSQSSGISQWEGEMGFETHRPSDRAYSPIKVVRFAEREENNESSEKSDQRKDLHFQDHFSEGSCSHTERKETDGTDEIEELKEKEEERDMRGYHDEKQSLAFQGEGGEEYIQESFQGEVASNVSVSDICTRKDAGQTFNFFRNVKPSSIDAMNDLDFPQPVSQCLHQVDCDSVQKMQTEPTKEAKRKVRGTRRPRTPEEHRKGVQRHHQREREKDRLVEVLSEEEEDEGRSQGVMQENDLRLSLGSINTSTEIDQNTFFTEIPSGIMQNGNNMHNYDHLACEMDERHQRRGDDEDDESVLMEKISQFYPTESFGEGGDGGSEYMVNGSHATVKGYHDLLTSHPELLHGRKDDVTFQSQGILPPSDGFVNLSINTSTLNPHDHSLNPLAEGHDATGKGNKGRGSVKTKSQEERPKSASQSRTSASNQYKSRWPQSSNLIPSRPKKVNQRFSSPERKMSKKQRPASAKVKKESLDGGSKGQRSRPWSAIQQNYSMEPGASGDFFSVQSSKMFESGITRASLVTGPLTLKLILDSPRERQHHSIWQLLPDEILLRIFSHLRHPDLVSCAQVCQGFYCVAMDDSLWRFIHLEKKHLSDYQLTQIGEKHPTSVVFLQCQGKNVTENGLRNLFRTCVDSLQELNVSGCSGEMFSGDSVLLHASRCYNLSNIDASWCNVTDNGLNAVSGGCHR
ncbi:F-box/LRR-repeat protein 7 [Holothuria leucospilota]|uniref:F-box/LRR-repeat protein 7 n=1 Tax=Holothuria leucospilota TaxID=206669 RepID=A0A9Q1HIC6_HOLLE|nr:F-box/LRR-repeat protein 7 [Holothuria leucospilota]